MRKRRNSSISISSSKSNSSGKAPKIKQTTSTSSKISPNKDNKIQQVYIDQDWVCDKIEADKNMFECPVCFHCIFQPVQCKNCERLFCRQDYVDIKKLKDCCPLCKNTPWVVKQTIHIAYRTLQQSLTFTCKLCKQTTNKLTRKQLQSHLLQKHNTKIKQFKPKIYKYTLILQNPANNIQLDFYQNLQINSYFQQGHTSLRMFIQKLGETVIDIKNLQYAYKDKTKTIKTGKIKQIQAERDDPLCQDKQFVAWGFTNDKMQTSYYLSDHQKLIQQGYKQFQKSPTLSEIHIDCKESSIRYRIMFKQMVQVNVSTNFKRPLERNIIKLI